MAQRLGFGFLPGGAFLNDVFLRILGERGAAARYRGDHLASFVSALAQGFDLRLAAGAPVGRPSNAAARMVVSDRAVVEIPRAPFVARGGRLGGRADAKQRDEPANGSTGGHIVAPITQGANSSSP